MLSGGYTYVPLASFSAAGPVGSAPQGQLAIFQGSLYGFTSTGGANGTGTAYEVQPGNPSPILLASFPAATSSTSSAVSAGPVVDSAGDVFGATQSGSQDGTVFEIPNGSGALSTLATFNSTTTGSVPGGNLVLDSSGDLFGTTASGGANGAGTVWELPKGSTSVTSLADFSPDTVNGVSENPGTKHIAMDTHGNLIGTTASGGANGFGTVWELPKGSQSIQTLAAFNGFNGMTPTGNVAVDRFGDIFGVTQFGGASFKSQATPQGTGTVWEVPASGGQIANLASFTNRSGGAAPAGGVVRDQNGNLFGTTAFGGAAGAGTVWEIPNGSTNLTTIQTFAGTNGANPRGDLVTDSFGNVYGTTSAGGPDQGGTLFVMDRGGASFSAADLTASVVRTTLPSTLPAGRSSLGRATVAISNSSPSPVRGVFTINVYAAPGGALDASATQIGSVTRPLEVRRNGATLQRVPVLVSPADATGDVTLLAQVVDAAGNASNVSGGPTVTVTAPSVSLSETFTRITLPTTLVSGQRTQGLITLQITNDGNVASVGPVQITLVLSPQSGGGPDTPIASAVRLPVIAPGRSVRVRVPVTSIPDGLNGTFTLAAQVTDPAGGTSTADSGMVFTVSPPA
ncbi:MAG TPA: choice-of-anchor tandem repeat GloVer-containing protein [Tepidisphaeraceae bacterium]